MTISTRLFKGYSNKRIESLRFLPILLNKRYKAAKNLDSEPPQVPELIKGTFRPVSENKLTSTSSTSNRGQGSFKNNLPNTLITSFTLAISEVSRKVIRKSLLRLSIPNTLSRIKIFLRTFLNLRRNCMTLGESQKGCWGKRKGIRFECPKNNKRPFLAAKSRNSSKGKI